VFGIRFPSKNASWSSRACGHGGQSRASLAWRPVRDCPRAEGNHHPDAHDRCSAWVVVLGPAVSIRPGRASTARMLSSSRASSRVWLGCRRCMFVRHRGPRHAASGEQAHDAESGRYRGEAAPGELRDRTTRRRALAARRAQHAQVRRHQCWARGWPLRWPRTPSRTAQVFTYGPH
jgi:hypothetical protein